MKIDEINSQLQKFEIEKKRMFITTSLQSHSIPLLHILRKSGVSIDYYFLNTGFHFPDTLKFKKQIADLLDIEIISLESDIPRIMQLDNERKFYFTSDPDYCCYMNKIKPLEPILKSYDVWINGIRANQNKNRSKMKIFESTPQKCVRFHPILDWNDKMIYEYRKKYNLPDHPLDKKGYTSIGCEPCTIKFSDLNERDSRWYGSNKNECGLHVDLVEKK